MQRQAMICLTGPKNRGWEFRVIRGIGIMLRFEAKPQVARILITIRALKGTAPKIGAIYLDTRFGGMNLHDAPGFWILEPRGKREVPGLLVFDHEAMIVTATKLALFDLADALAHRVRRAKIQWRAFYWRGFSGGNKRVVH